MGPKNEKFLPSRPALAHEKPVKIHRQASGGCAGTKAKRGCTMLRVKASHFWNESSTELEYGNAAGAFLQTLAPNSTISGCLHNFIYFIQFRTSRLAGFGTLIGRRRCLPVPALDKASPICGIPRPLWCPQLVCVLHICADDNELI